MEPISGFLSFDGKFFSSSEACSAYEERLAHLSGLAERCKAVVDACRSAGAFSSPGFPKGLQEHLQSIPIEDYEDLWNEYLMYLFVEEDEFVYEKAIPERVVYEVYKTGEYNGGIGVWDCFELKAETAYRLLAFVLNKPL